MASGNSNPLVTGAFTGTGSLITVGSVGFRPKRVTLINLTDPAHGVHLDSMAADSVLVGTTTFAAVTSDGVTLTDTGFTVGTDANFNTSGEVVYWCAEG